MAAEDTLILILTGARENIVLEAEKATITYLQLVRQLRASGMGEDEIRQLILRDLIESNPVYFGAYKNALKEKIAGAAGQAYQEGVAELFEGQQIKWITVGDESSCLDCNERAGMTGTMEFFRLIGLPKSGFSRCGQRCRCELAPSGVEVENNKLSLD